MSTAETLTSPNRRHRRQAAALAIAALATAGILADCGGSNNSGGSSSFEDRFGIKLPPADQWYIPKGEFVLGDTQTESVVVPLQPASVEQPMHAASFSLQELGIVQTTQE